MIFFTKPAYCQYLIKGMVVICLFLYPFKEMLAQTGSRSGAQVDSLYYYFGSQKINLSTSRTHIYVETSTSSNITVLQNNLLGAPQVAMAQLESLSMVTRGVITLIDPSGFESTLGWLKQQPGVVVVRPAVHSEDNKDQLYEENFYVKLKSGTNALMLENEVTKRGCSIVQLYEYDKRVYLINAGSAAGFDGLEMANRFYETGLFEFSEPDFRPLDLLHSPPPANDSLYNLQWALKNTGSPAQFNGTAGADINIENAWAVTRGSPTIRIAVIDDGVERAHPDLVNNIDPLGFGLLGSNATTGNILSSNRSHGTSCAGIIAAEADNGIGVAGIAPLCKIIPVNLTINTTGNYGTNSQIATCIDWAWNQGGADILSNSWGGGAASSLIHDAIKRAVTLGRGGKGCVVLFSSGNADAGLANPAIFPETIAVGAMDMCYQRKSINTCDAENFWGGNYGKGLDVSAPGVKIATTKNGGYNPTFNGTSSACPIAAGVAALILSVNANLTQAQAREILERSSRKVGSSTYSRVTGQPNGSWSNEMGYGMVNAFNAVSAVPNFDFSCKVNIQANGPIQFCPGGSVNLQVAQVFGAAIYSWLRNGVQTSQGSQINATTSGIYQAIILRNSGCRDTSSGIEVRVPASTGTLQARAGNDTAVCVTTMHIMGGGPSAIGGTALLNPLRGMAQNGAANEFFRFDPKYPSEFFKAITSDFNPDANQFYSGAANTPYGLFMISRNDKFVKVDTATGEVTTLGIAVPASGFWHGMTYQPLQQKVYAVASNGSTNQLYEISYRTGTPVLLGTINGSNNMELIWIAADANGDLYTMRISSSGSSQIFRINLSPLSLTALPNGTGFQSNFAQDGEFDPITGKLLLFGVTRPIGSNANYPGLGLWEGDKATGVATQIGAVGHPFNWMDALAFAGPEYTYSWSPATYLSNTKDANPIFSGAPPGSYTYTLTVTDLCGQTAQSTVKVVVKPVVTPNASGVLFVNAAANGNNTGTSWMNAVKSLQAAIQNSCSDVKQIWVASGTYKPTPDSNRDSAFLMRSNLAIYGGFAGTETSLAQRNWKSNVTILSGNIGVLNLFADNSYSVVEATGVNATAVLDGFTIVGGNGNAGGGLDPTSRGGGLYIGDNGSPTVTNCFFTGNFSDFGGAIYLRNNTFPTITNCAFAGNGATFNGGGIFNESSAGPVILNCSFSGNLISAISNAGGNAVVVKNSIIWGNASGITGAVATVTNTIVQGGYAGSGNLNVNPLFVGQPAIVFGATGNLRLSPCSPAIDAGLDAANTTTKDLDGNNRKVVYSAGVNAIDMGAYERPAYSNIVFVDATATGKGDGSSWLNAYISLQQGLIDYNGCIEMIQMAAGTYSNGGQPIQLDRLNGVIMGGYPSGGGARNPTVHVTTIVGEVNIGKSLSLDGVKVQRP